MSKRITHDQRLTHWINAKRLGQEQRADLAATMSKRLSREKVDHFLQMVSDEVDMWEHDRRALEGPKEKEMKTKLGRIERAAKGLSSILRGLDGRTFYAFASQFDTLLRASEPERPIPAALRRPKPDCRDWLNQQIEALQIIESVAGYTAVKLKPTKDSIRNRQLRELVRLIANRYHDIFGKNPPNSAWFFAFMQTLGEQIDVEIGRELVIGVLSYLNQYGSSS